MSDLNKKTLLIKRMCRATLEWGALLFKLCMVLASIATMLILHSAIFLLPLLACVWLWQRI
jgi:hypothetical protein